MRSLVVGLLLLSSACTHLTSVSLTSIPVSRETKVSSEKYKFVFLLFNFDNTFAEGIEKDLANSCPNGRVQGILTKTEHITYFPLIAHAWRIKSEGYCVKDKK